MDYKKQELAIRKIISSKTLMPLIIVYSNPYSFEQILFKPIKKFLKVFFKIINYFKFIFFRKSRNKEREFYFQPHSLLWWEKFSDTSIVEIKLGGLLVQNAKIAFPITL